MTAHVRRTAAPCALAVMVLLMTACATVPARSMQSNASTIPEISSTVPSAAPPTAALSTVAAAPSTSTLVDADKPCLGSGGAPVEQVVWIVMENHTREQVLNDVDAAYVPRLTRACAMALDYRAVGSPSLPNYLGATSGSTYGIRDDGSPAAHPLTADNVFRQVRVSGRRAISYEESMPAPCTLSSSGRYAVRHNPAAYFTGADDRTACARDDVPLGNTDRGALADAIDTDAMAALTFITPDLCNDTHDCPVAIGDAWLARWVTRLVASAPYQRGTMVIFVAWDEPSPMPFIVVSRSVAPGTTIPGTMDHYTLLRITEELLGLPLLGAAQQAADVRAVLGR